MIEYCCDAKSTKANFTNCYIKMPCDKAFNRSEIVNSNCLQNSFDLHGRANKTTWELNMVPIHVDDFSTSRSMTNRKGLGSSLNLIFIRVCVIYMIGGLSESISIQPKNRTLTENMEIQKSRLKLFSGLFAAQYITLTSQFLII